MVIEHDSRNILYRTPFGAVPCLSNITLRLYVKADKIPASITLVYSFKHALLMGKWDNGWQFYIN